jgi:hypothetical protein
MIEAEEADRMHSAADESRAPALLGECLNQGEPFYCAP